METDNVQPRVQRGLVRVQRGLEGAAWLSRVQCGLVKVQRGLVGSALACRKAGPSSNLGSAPYAGSAH